MGTWLILVRSPKCWMESWRKWETLSPYQFWYLEEGAGASHWCPWALASSSITQTWHFQCDSHSRVLETKSDFKEIRDQRGEDGLHPYFQQVVWSQRLFYALEYLKAQNKDLVNLYNPRLKVMETKIRVLKGGQELETAGVLLSFPFLSAWEPETQINAWPVPVMPWWGERPCFLPQGT